MHGLRFGVLLASTAIALVFAARSTPAYAVADNEKAIEALVPVPDTTIVPPPSATEVAPAAKPSPTTAAPASPAAQPATTLAEADQQVADKLREYLTGKSDRVIDRKSRPAVDAFYAARNYAPLWIDQGNAGERAKAVAAFLAKVDADGLDPADYVLPTIKAGADAAALAEAELKYTATVLTYARHAQIGRVHYSRISSDIAYTLVAPEPADVLGGVADANGIAAALERFNPPHAGYKALKAKLAEPRAGKGDAGNTTYDKPLADAMKKFQDGRGLSATGTLTTATVDALNGPKQDRAADVILANMERWRWLPRDLGKTHVVVNIPDFTLRVVSNGATVWTTRIVTGQPGQKATPLLSETMKYITVNPTWNVPPSIINNEYLPALQQDPGALERIGLKLEHNRDGTVRIYQPPGERNALGRIRFNFPNKFLVYQHDTPDKHLFAKDKRAFSHGCMRVQFPDKYAETLLNIANPRDGYTADRIRKMYGTGERDIHLTTPIPVHLTYQTAYVDDGGQLVIREDVYGRDARLLAALKGEDRRVADVPIERREASISTKRQASRMPLPFTAPSSFFGGFFR